MLVSKSLNNFGGIFDFLRKFNELGSMLDARTSRLDPMPDTNVVFSFKV